MNKMNAFVRRKKAELTPWLTDKMSFASVGLSNSGSAAKWKAAGRRTPMTLIVNNDELSCVAPTEHDK